MSRNDTDPEYPKETGERLDGRNLINEWVNKHSNSLYVWNKRAFDQIDVEKTDHVMGEVSLHTLYINNHKRGHYVSDFCLLQFAWFSKHDDAAICIVICKFYFQTLPPFFFWGGGGVEKMGKPTTYNFYVAYYL